MKIADLFFEGRLDDGPLQVDAKKSGDKAGKTLGSSMAASLKNGSKDLMSGIKLGAGIAAFGGLTTAISGTVAMLGDAIQAAREDEESQARLGAALKANIPNWDGNTKAIEETIASRQRLGFTDEEQRTSLALLVVATNDATKALELQRAAMDLARLKNISLADASSALIKIEGGQFKALKALGIQLPKNATATEALAAVQKAAAGSAEDFANTSKGKLLASQIKLGEAFEKLGYIIMPAVTEAMLALAEGATTVVDGIASIGEALAEVGGPLDEFLKDATGSSDVLKDLGFGLDAVAYAMVHGGNAAGYWEYKIREAQEKAVAAAEQAAAETHVATKSMGDSLADVADKGDRSSRSLVDNAEDIGSAFKQLKRDLLGDAQAIVTGYYDRLILEDNLRATNYEINAQRLIIASKTSTDAQKRDARIALHQLEADQAQMLQDLAEHGASTSKTFTKTLAGLYTKLKNAHGAEKKAILAEILALQLLAIQANIATNAVGATIAKGGYVSAAGAQAATNHHATGGHMAAREPGWVGEGGPELWIPDVAGRVIPHGQSMAMAAAGSGGGDTYQVNLLDRMEVRSVRDIGAGLRMLGETGNLGRRKR